MSGGISMFAKPKVSGKEIIVSILLGVSASLISLALLWNGIGAINGERNILPVSDTKNEGVIFYATQHGVFSTQQAAAEFQKQYPTLNTSVIVELEGQYYLWSSLHVAKATLNTTPTSFSKQLTLSGASCEAKEVTAIPTLLQDDSALKNNFDASDVPADWKDTVTKLSAITSEVAQIRLLLFEHYRQQQSCLKINFD